MLRSYSGVLGVALEQPTRSQITVDDRQATIVIANPYNASLSAVVDGARCDEDDDGTKAVFTCHVAPGQHQIHLFGAPEPKARTLESFGSILVNAR
jgi:hypothetical protein